MQTAFEAAVEMLGPYPPPPGAQAAACPHYGPGGSRPIISTRAQAHAEVEVLVDNYRRALELAEEAPRPRQFVDHLAHIGHLAHELCASLTSLSWVERRTIGNPGDPTARFKDRKALRAMLDAELPIHPTEMQYDYAEFLEVLIKQASDYVDKADASQLLMWVKCAADQARLVPYRRDPGVRFSQVLPAPFVFRGHVSLGVDGLLADLLGRAATFFALLSDEMQWDLTNGGTQPLDRGGNIDIDQQKAGTPNWRLAFSAWEVVEHSPNLTASAARARKAPPPHRREALAKVEVFDAPSFAAFLDKIVEAATGRRASDFDMFGAELAVLQYYRPRMLALRRRIAKLHLRGKSYTKIDVWARLGNPGLEAFENSGDADPTRVPEYVVRSIRSNWRRYHLLHRQMESEKHARGRKRRLRRKAMRKSRMRPASVNST